MGPVHEWMISDDSERVQEILDFYGSFLLTGLDILADADLLSPTSPVPNIKIITLLIRSFLETHVTDVSYSVDWSHEVVRFIDKAGIEMKSRTDLSMGCVKLSQAKIDSLRNAYKAREARSKKKDIPARDWKKEYAKFRRQGHTGSTKYDITEMSAAENKKHSFGL